MSVDLDRLRALAEKAIRDGVLSLSMSRFRRAADPQTCLTLIEELEACRRAFKALADYDGREELAAARAVVEAYRNADYSEQTVEDALDAYDRVRGDK